MPKTDQQKWIEKRAVIAKHRMHARAARQQARYDVDALETAAHHDAEAERLEAELEAAGHKRPRVERGPRRYRPNPHHPGAWLAEWCASDESYAVLDETSAAGSSWMAGACVLLAKAIRKAYPDARLVGIETPAGIQHVGARIGDTVYDALGAHDGRDPHAWVRDWLTYEQLPTRTLARVVRLAGVPRSALPDAESPATPADVAIVARALPDVRANPIVPPTTLAFRRWFAGSWVVDDKGQPLLVYRGEHGEDTSELVRSRMGSGVLSFTNSADLASHFAMERHREGETPTPRLVPVYLRIKNPVITPDDVDQTGAEFTVSTQTMIDRVGRAAVKKVFDELRPGLMDDPEYALPPFGYLNNAAFVQAAKKKGYDGALFLGDYLLFEKGRYINFGLCMEYRPFSSDQVWPALGTAPLG